MKKSAIIITWGLITSLILIVLYEIINRADVPNKALQWCGYLFIFGGLLMGTLQYRKANGGFITFGEGYKTGLLMTLIITFVSTIHFMVFLYFHPEFSEKMIALQQAEMVNRGISADQMDKALSMERAFMSPTALTIFSFLGGIISGAIISLLTSGICMKKRPFIEEENTTIE